MTDKILFVCPHCGNEQWECDNGERVRCELCNKAFSLCCEWCEVIEDNKKQKSSDKGKKYVTSFNPKAQWEDD